MNIVEFLNRDDNKQWLIVAVVCVAVIFATVMLFSSDISKRVRAPEVENQFLPPVQQARAPLTQGGQFQQPVQQALPGNGIPVAITGATPKMMANGQPVAMTGATPKMLANGRAVAMATATTNMIAAPGNPNAVATPTPSIINWMNTIIDLAKPAVVGICVGSTGTVPPWQQGWEVNTPTGKSSIGSGVLISPKGYVLTNYHVVGKVPNIVVSLFNVDGSYAEYPATLVAGYERYDLALIKINSNTVLPYLAMGNSDTVLVGDKVVAIGNPFGLTQTVTTGIISAKRARLPIGKIVLKDVFQTDVPINPGNSGGALLNLNGELIGINSAIFSPTGVYTGVSFAIPVNQTKTLFSKYLNPATVPANFKFVKAGTPLAPVKGNKINGIQPSPGEGIEEIAWLGIDLLPAGKDGGVEVDEIEGISPMEAGLQAGDIIHAINGMPIKDIYALKDTIKKVPLKVDQGVVFDVFRPRDNKSMYINFRLKKWDILGR